MNQTIRAFGYPETLIKEYPNWVALLRPEQVTVGSLVLASKSEALHLGELSAGEWAEFADISNQMEALLRERFGAEKFNYLALMMVDLNVHFHLIPRYSKPVKLGGREYLDPDWPSKTELTSIKLTTEELSQVKLVLKS